MALIENAHLLARRYLYQSIELAASSRFIALNYKLQNIDRKEIDQSIDRAEIDRLLK